MRARRAFACAAFGSALAACISRASTDTSTVLKNPDDPTATVATTPSTADVCGTICDALIEDYGVPQNLKSACVFECASGFNEVPQACYELVACIADKSLCSAGDISAPCEAKAGDCFAQWSLANGTCRGCWEPSRTVHGKQIVTYFSGGTPSQQDVPEDYSRLDIAALLPRSSGAPYRFPGKGNADGTYEIANVPGCGVWIQVGTTYTWATNADVDTSYQYPGRKNAQTAGPNTFYAIQLNNLVAWTKNDWVEFFVPQLSGYLVGSFYYITPFAPKPIPDGATTFQWRYKDDTGALIDASQNDVMYVADLPTKTLPDGTLVRAITRAAAISGVTATSGTTTSMVANLVDVPASKSLHIDWRRSTYLAYTADFHPASSITPPGSTAAPSYGVLDILAHPGRQNLGGSADLVLVEKPNDMGDVPPVDVPLATPYAADWGVDVLGQVLLWLTLHDRNGGAHDVYESINTDAPLDVQGSAPVAARISPMKNLRINAQSAFVAQDGGPLTPAIAWDPPSLGAPTTYNVSVIELTSDNAGIGTTVATFVIPTLPGASAPALRSFTVPPGLLQAGHDYYFAFYVRDTANERNDSAIVLSSEYRP